MMATSNDYTRSKTILALAVVVGCFAILWPKVFYPSLEGLAGSNSGAPTKDERVIKKNPKKGVCCGVVFDESDVSQQILAQVCSSVLSSYHNEDADPDHHQEKTAYSWAALALEHGGKLPDKVATQCRQQVQQKCGQDVVWLLAQFSKPQTKAPTAATKQQRPDPEVLRAENLTLCLQQQFNVDPALLQRPHRVQHAVQPLFTPRHMRPERSTQLHPEVTHPALREKGRVAPPIRTIDRQAKPGPLPGMRPPMGGGGHVVTPGKAVGGGGGYGGSIGIIMPIYTIGIIVFFVYTISKVMFRSGKQEVTAPDNFASGLQALKDFPLSDPVIQRQFLFPENRSAPPPAPESTTIHEVKPREKSQTPEPVIDTTRVSDEQQCSHTPATTISREATPPVISTVPTTQAPPPGIGNEAVTNQQDPQLRLHLDIQAQKDLEMDQLRRRLEETEKAMARIMAHMGTVSDKLAPTVMAEVLAQAERVRQGKEALLSGQAPLETASEVMDQTKAFMTLLQEAGVDADLSLSSEILPGIALSGSTNNSNPDLVPEIINKYSQATADSLLQQVLAGQPAEAHIEPQTALESAQTAKSSSGIQEEPAEIECTLESEILETVKPVDLAEIEEQILSETLELAAAVEEALVEPASIPKPELLQTEEVPAAQPASVSVMNMEVSVALENKAKMSRSPTPVKDLLPRHKHDSGDSSNLGYDNTLSVAESGPQDISLVFLEAVLPAESQLLVSEAECRAEAMPLEQLDLSESEYETAPVVLSGKMTLSVIGMELPPTGNNLQATEIEEMPTDHIAPWVDDDTTEIDAPLICEQTDELDSIPRIHRVRFQPEPEQVIIPANDDEYYYNEDAEETQDSSLCAAEAADNTLSDFDAENLDEELALIGASGVELSSPSSVQVGYRPPTPPMHSEDEDEGNDDDAAQFVTYEELEELGEIAEAVKPKEPTEIIQEQEPFSNVVEGQELPTTDGIKTTENDHEFTPKEPEDNAEPLGEIDEQTAISDTRQEEQAEEVVSAAAAHVLATLGDLLLPAVIPSSSNEEESETSVEELILAPEEDATTQVQSTVELEPVEDLVVDASTNILEPEVVVYLTSEDEALLVTEIKDMSQEREIKTEPENQDSLEKPTDLKETKPGYRGSLPVAQLASQMVPSSEERDEREPKAEVVVSQESGPIAEIEKEEQEEDQAIELNSEVDIAEVISCDAELTSTTIARDQSPIPESHVELENCAPLEVPAEPKESTSSEDGEILAIPTEVGNLSVDSLEVSESLDPPAVFADLTENNESVACLSGMDELVEATEQSIEDLPELSNPCSGQTRSELTATPIKQQESPILPAQPIETKELCKEDENLVEAEELPEVTSKIEEQLHIDLLESLINLEQKPSTQESLTPHDELVESHYSPVSKNEPVDSEGLPNSQEERTEVGDVPNLPELALIVSEIPTESQVPLVTQIEASEATDSPIQLESLNALERSHVHEHEAANLEEPLTLDSHTESVDVTQAQDVTSTLDDSSAASEEPSQTQGSFPEIQGLTVITNVPTDDSPARIEETLTTESAEIPAEQTVPTEKGSPSEDSTKSAEPTITTETPAKLKESEELPMDSDIQTVSAESEVTETSLILEPSIDSDKSEESPTESGIQAVSNDSAKVPEISVILEQPTASKKSEESHAESDLQAVSEESVEKTENSLIQEQLIASEESEESPAESGLQVPSEDSAKVTETSLNPEPPIDSEESDESPAESGLQVLSKDSAKVTETSLSPEPPIDSEESDESPAELGLKASSEDSAKVPGTFLILEPKIASEESEESPTESEESEVSSAELGLEIPSKATTNPKASNEAQASEKESRVEKPLTDLVKLTEPLLDPQRLQLSPAESDLLVVSTQTKTPKASPESVSEEETLSIPEVPSNSNNEIKIFDPLATLHDPQESVQETPKPIETVPEDRPSSPVITECPEWEQIQTRTDDPTLALEPEESMIQPKDTLTDPNLGDIPEVYLEESLSEGSEDPEIVLQNDSPVSPPLQDTDTSIRDTSVLKELEDIKNTLITIQQRLTDAGETLPEPEPESQPDSDNPPNCDTAPLPEPDDSMPPTLSPINFSVLEPEPTRERKFSGPVVPVPLSILEEIEAQIMATAAMMLAQEPTPIEPASQVQHFPPTQLTSPRSRSEDRESEDDPGVEENFVARAVRFCYDPDSEEQTASTTLSESDAMMAELENAMREANGLSSETGCSKGSSPDMEDYEVVKQDVREESLEKLHLNLVPQNSDESKVTESLPSSEAGSAESVISFELVNSPALQPSPTPKDT